jgi:enoyl-CoA hydratase/carnithine racemase
MDLILTSRGVQGDQALLLGLVNRLVPRGQALDAAVRLGHFSRSPRSKVESAAATRS